MARFLVCNDQAFVIFIGFILAHGGRYSSISECFLSTFFAKLTMAWYLYAWPNLRDGMEFVMPSIKKMKIIAYSQEQMYALVNDVVNYKEFVPWCTESHILSQTEDEIKATLAFSGSGLSKSFTTLNRLQPHKMIEIRLIDGPFRQLEGFWQFDAIGEERSKVSLDLEFEFSTKIVGLMFGPVFHQVATTLVDAFCHRAEKVYGSGTA